MKKPTITPTRLRIALSILLILLIAAGVGVFTLGYQQLKLHAEDAQKVATEAEASRTSLQRLITVEKFLASNQDVVERADRLVSQSKLYYYQDQMINDINKYASESGIEITNMTFDNTKVTAVAPGTPATTTAPSVAPTDIKSKLATISIKNPTNYDSMLAFIHRIEQSLFSMQITRVGMSQSAEPDKPDQVTSDAFTIEVYVRE